MIWLSVLSVCEQLTVVNFEGFLMVCPFARDFASVGLCRVKKNRVY